MKALSKTLGIATFVAALALTATPADAAKSRANNKTTAAKKSAKKKSARKAQRAPARKSALSGKIQKAQAKLDSLKLEASKANPNFSKLVASIGKGKLAIVGKSYVDVGHPTIHEFNVAVDGKGQVYIAARAPKAASGYVAIKLQPGQVEAASMIRSLAGAVNSGATAVNPASFKIIPRPKKF